jgi:glycosyltransferase involved in cell wall biosynthesis
MVEALSRKINILEMHSSFGFAGGQRNLFTFSKFLDRSIFNVFAASYVEGGAYELKLNEIGVKTLSAERDASKILAFIEDNKIDAIHLHRSGGTVKLESEILQGARKINPNLVIAEKNIFGKYDQDNVIDCSFFQSMMHLNERYLPASGKKFDFEKMKVMYNMVDGKEFIKYILSPEERLEARTKFGIKSKDFVLGKIGRPDLAKWSDLVFEATPHLAKLVPNFKYILVGVPKSRVKKIRNSALLSKHFIIQPPTSDERKVHTFYQVIDVLGHSSKIGECNGNTINEAMFWGKPVITNSTPNKDNGQLEQFEHMESGIIANNPQTFARAVEFLAKDADAYRRMSEEGKKRVLTVNDPLQTVRRVEKYFVEKIAENKLIQNLPISEKYSKISYYPSREDIVAYKTEYQKKLSYDFGTLSALERARNASLLPGRLFYKFKDFFEHKTAAIWKR